MLKKSWKQAHLGAQSGFLFFLFLRIHVWCSSCAMFHIGVISSITCCISHVLILTTKMEHGPNTIIQAY